MNITEAKRTFNIGYHVMHKKHNQSYTHGIVSEVRNRDSYIEVWSYWGRTLKLALEHRAKKSCRYWTDPDKLKVVGKTLKLNNLILGGE